jgi:AcrR family transcriptional regulator
MTRPLRADARRNQERLISVARDAFRRDGLNASLDEIARTANVGPGTLYRHFPTRDALLVAVYRDDVAVISARVDELAATRPPMEALTAWLEEQLDFMVRNHGSGPAFKAVLSNDAETLQWCRDTMRGAIGRLLALAQRDGLIRADVDATTVLRMLHGVAVASENDPERSSLMLSIVLGGLRP